MEAKLNFNNPILNLLIIVFFLTMNSELIAQEKESTEMNYFKIVIENTENGIQMQSAKGSAWIDLSFSLINNRPQAIDEYGLTELDKVSSKKDSNLVDFLFTIEKTNNVVKLKGVQGTAWTDLSFSIVQNGKQAIDPFGMTKPN